MYKKKYSVSGNSVGSLVHHLEAQRVRWRAVNVDNVNFRIRVFPSDMRVNVGRLFTSVLAIRAQKSWLLSALVFQMTGKTRFLAEATRAIRTREPCLCLGKRLFDLNETEASRT